MTTITAPHVRALLGAITTDLKAIVADTAALARVEVRVATTTLVWSIVGIAIGGVLALAGLGALVSALILGGIALGLAPWASALIVALLLIIAGAGMLYLNAGKMKDVQLDLRETRASLRETLDWLRQETLR